MLSDGVAYISFIANVTVVTVLRTTFWESISCLTVSFDATHRRNFPPICSITHVGKCAIAENLGDERNKARRCMDYLEPQVHEEEREAAWRARGRGRVGHPARVRQLGQTCYVPAPPQTTEGLTSRKKSCGSWRGYMLS